METIYNRPRFLYSFVYAWMKSDKTGSAEFVATHLRRLQQFDREYE